MPSAEERRWQALWLLLLALIAWPREADAARQDQAIALVNATVVDVVNGTTLAGQTILTRNGRIERVAPSLATLPQGTRRVDVAGQYVIPGLWDMHSHFANGAPADLLAKYYGSLLIRYGVTGIRDAGGDPRVLRAFAASTLPPRGATPRVIFAGEKLGPVRGGKWSMADLDTAIAARRNEGASYVKLNPAYPTHLFRQTVARCAELNVFCVSHVPFADTAVWFGLRNRGSYEHLFGLSEHMSRIPATQLFEMIREYENPTIVQRVLYKLRLRRRPDAPDALLPTVRDTTRDAAFFGKVASAGLWMTPTLLLHHYMTRVDTVLATAIDTQMSVAPFVTPQVTAAQSRSLSQRWSISQQLVRSMNRSGVRMLAGSDLFTDHVPGAALHAELIFLQRAGVSAPAVLRMATRNPALYFGAQDSLGQVAVGHVADLVVLRRNPLTDIRYVTDIAMVMTRGRLYDHRGLDSLEAIAREGLRELRRRKQ